MKPKLTIFVLAVLALAGGYAVRALRDTDRTKAAIAALVSQRANWRATTASLEQRVRTAKDALAQLERKEGLQPGSSGSGVGADAAKAGQGTETPPVAPVRPLSPTTVIANDPQKMREFAQHYRASLGLSHGGMFKALRLSPAQIERFKDLQVWVKQQAMDLQAAAEMKGLDRNGEAYKKLQAQYDGIRMAKESELLGDLEGPYREYERTQVVRNLVRELAGGAVHSGEWMTSDQVERTAQILAANSRREESGLNRGWVIPNTVNWAAARVLLQDVLSPAQIANLGHLIQGKATFSEYKKEYLRLAAEFKARMPSP